MRETKKCPYCAEEIAFEAIKCRYCGEFFNNNSNLDLSKKIPNSTQIAKIDSTRIKEKNENVKSIPYQFKDRHDTFISFISPERGYTITPWLICLNFIIFSIMLFKGVSLFSPGSQDMIEFGANLRPLIIKGDWWRLVTSCFLHIGMLHLLLNMYILYNIGYKLESFIGEIKFLTVYILTGTISSLTSIWWHDNTVSAGASGAIFGLYGAFIAIFSTNMIDKKINNNFIYNIAIFVLYNLFYGLVHSGIDNAAHIGGLLSGLLIGYIYIPCLKNRNSKLLSVTTTIILIIFTYILSASTIGWIKNPEEFKFIKNLIPYNSIDNIQSPEIKPIEVKSDKPKVSPLIFNGNIGNNSIEIRITECTPDKAKFEGRYRYMNNHEYENIKGEILPGLYSDYVLYAYGYPDSLQKGEFFLELNEDTLEGVWKSCYDNQYDEGYLILDAKLIMNSGDREKLKIKSYEYYSSSTSNSITGEYKNSTYFLSNSENPWIVENGGTVIIKELENNQIYFRVHATCGLNGHHAEAFGLAEKIDEGIYIYKKYIEGVEIIEPDTIAECFIKISLKNKTAKIEANESCSNNPGWGWGFGADVSGEYIKISDKVEIDTEIESFDGSEFGN